MSEIAGIVERLHDAIDSLPVLGGEFCIWSDPNLARESVERRGVDLSSGDVRETRYRVLYAPDGRWHCETLDPSGQQAESGAVCDGHRTRTYNRGRVIVEPAGPPNIPLLRMLDPSWLLTGHILTFGGPTDVGGRPGKKVGAVSRARPGVPPQSAIRTARIEVVVDTALGILLSWERVMDRRALVRHTLSDVTLRPPIADADFTVQLRDGVTVIDHTAAGAMNKRPNLPIRLIAAAAAAREVFGRGSATPSRRDKTDL